MTTKTPEKKYTYIKDSATVYKIRLVDRSARAVITLRQWPRGGSIDIQSYCIDYFFLWDAITEPDFRQFLIGLDHSSLMNKTKRQCCMSTPAEPGPQCKGFWDTIWPIACEIWREELKAEGKQTLANR